MTATVTIIDNMDGIAAAASAAASRITNDLASLLDDWSECDEETRIEASFRWEMIIRDAVRKNLLGPEDLAMLQALYSRSPKTVLEHIARVQVNGSGSFVGTYYVGYGHASIGDCGTTTIFVEGISMLEAKAIQDWPLYSGQESSTRYIDFSTQPILDPFGTRESRRVQEQWMGFYHRAQEPLRDHLRATHPIQEGEDPKVYEKTVHARSFDILRGFIPAGATTNVAWTTNLRQASDKLNWLLAHPDRQVTALGAQIRHELQLRYPNSFSSDPKPWVSDRQAYYREFMAKHYYLHDYYSEAPTTRDRVYVDFTNLKHHEVLRYSNLLASRPRGADLPPFLAEAGSIRSSFHLDFGSFRDLQRHRNGVVRMPLLTPTKMHPWYIKQLPHALRLEADTLLRVQASALDELVRQGCDEVTLQYYVAMGYEVPCEVTQGLPAFVYRMDLRAGKMIHPTLRRVIHEEIRQLEHRYPQIKLHADMDPADWDLRRGTQTIEERP